nr:acetyltransferase [Burkholderia multivorans]
MSSRTDARRIAQARRTPRAAAANSWGEREQWTVQQHDDERHFFAFNGDADGLCALQQLRLAERVRGTLVTGVKRDIRLLERIDARAGDRVTVLDISHDQNRDACARLLRAGATVRYFDHHFAGELPDDPRFEAHIDTAADVCTSVLVNRHLGGRHVRWAIVAAFGDELPALGDALAHAHAIDAAERDTLAELGRYLNYNAYGDCIGDLHFDPAALADAMLPCADPLEFVRDTAVFAALRDGYLDDMARACALAPLREVSGATLIRMPDRPWARRVAGMLANQRMRDAPHAALAVLSPRAQGGLVVSVRVPDGRPLGADEFCRGFPTGGGRKRAGGINHLPESEFDAFVARFEAAFRLG